MFNGFPVITSLILLPLLGSAGLFFIKRPGYVRAWALGVSLVELILALPLLSFRLDTSHFQFVERVSWVREWGLEYFVGLDGIGLLMVGLTLVILPVTILCSWSSINTRLRGFYSCVLVLASVCVGVFSALDLVLFFLFWEAILIPVYLVIAVWGGPQRRHASLKFIIYTLAGSALLLVAVIAFRVWGGTFSIPGLMEKQFPVDFQLWTFPVMALAFAVKVPMFPFHTWLPDAYTEAPAPGSVVLAAVLSKMGAYGFLRLCLPLAPEASRLFGPMMIYLSIASVLYGGVAALGQSNIKRIISYSSLAHMGFVTAGIFLFNLRGSQGAVFQMVGHGITTGALFILAGILHERSRSYEIGSNLGLGRYVPAFMGLWGFMAFAGFAFPGTGNFVGEFLILVGAFENSGWIGAMLVPGAVLAAAYMLRPTQKMAWGQPSYASGWKDLNPREWATLVPLAFLVLFLGLAPSPFFRAMNPTLNHAMTVFKGKAVTESVKPGPRPYLNGPPVPEREKP